MTEDKISALLGRPLSSIETQNFNTYLELAQSKVSDLFGADICAEHDTKTFVPRRGYRTLNLPIFSGTPTVKVAGAIVNTNLYSLRQGASLSGDWYNSIVFLYPQYATIEVEADWGFYDMPLDVQLMVAEQFALMSSSNKLEEDTVSMKVVEDFRVSYNGTTKQGAFDNKYAATIAKYNCRVTSNVQMDSGYGLWGNRYERLHNL